MTTKPPQSDDRAADRPGGAPEADQAARDEEELLDVLAGRAVDQLLQDQAADLDGAAAGLAEDTPMVDAAAPVDDASAEDDADDEGASDPQPVTAEELDALFGPPAETRAAPADEEGEGGSTALDDLFPEP
ncbi:MAG: hypothetical protein ACOC95_10410, partial [Planctomycetota bacterium]